MPLRSCVGVCKIMSEHKNDSSVEQQDQAFIDALYNDLETIPSPTTLDDRILAAAHQAVASKPVSVKRRPHWLKPLSAVATVLLVSSVSLHQLFDPAAPLDADAYVSESMYLEDAMFSARSKSEAKVFEKTKIKEQVQTSAKFKPMPKQKAETNFAAQAKSRVAKKSVKSADVQALMSQPRSVSYASPEPAVALEVAALSDESIVDTEEVLETEALIDTELLSKKTFIALSAGVWIYQQQNDQYYWLQYQGDTNIDYQVDKTVFSLSQHEPLTIGDTVHLQLNDGGE